MGTTHPAPTSRDWQEHLRQFLDECGLLLRREHQIAVALDLEGERGEYSPVYAEIDRAHVGAFHGPFQAQCDPAKICGVHENYFNRWRKLVGVEL